MSETEFNIDEAEQQYNDARGEGEGDGGAGEGEGDQQQQQQQQDDTPPGFKTYEEYVADGGDPDNYVGKAAYQQHYERIQDNKALRSEVKGLQTTVQQTMEATQTVLEQTEARVRQEVQAELAAAREAEDVDAAIEAQKKLDNMDAVAEQRKNQPPPNTGEHTEIQTFRAANPMLDRDSDQFDEDFNADVEAAFNAYATKGLTATDAQVKKALRAAMADAKALNPDKFQSPRNSRQQNNQGRQQRRQTTQDDQTPSAEGYVIDNPRNPRQKNAAPEVRDMIRKTAEEGARKAGKDDAAIKKAGDTAAKNFERSLANG